MRRLSCLLISLMLSVVALSTFAASTTSPPTAGQHAPAFRLQDQRGHWVKPADYHGHWLVLYFYPKDFTPGCTTEVCTFRDAITNLRKAGADVVGISLDDVKSHAQFARKYHVPFPLLADADHSVAERYGVLTAAGKVHYAKRTTFLINPQGRIAKVYKNVDPKENSAQVLRDLATLKADS